VDPTLRILKLLTLLQTHRSWSGDSLAEKLSVSPRTLRRDIERLREFGYRISAERGEHGGYQLDVGSELPPLVLDDDEAVAMVVGLRSNSAGSVAGIEEASVTALAKVEQVMPSRLQKKVKALSKYVETGVFSDRPKIDLDIVVELAQACRDCVRVEFAFTGGTGDLVKRRVEPHRLVSLGMRWYLLAWDNDRNDWRTFRSDRIQEVCGTGRGFSPREIPGGNATDFVKATVGSMWGGVDVAIVFEAPVEDVQKRWPARGCEFEAVGSSQTRVTTSTDSLAWMAMSAAVTGFVFEVEKPPELIEECRTLAARLQR
jgi:predicted DNA-binding transcriptional regulator YafY